jgi:RNA polymerase sigma-70 factor (ECF subfamily)
MREEEARDEELIRRITGGDTDAVRLLYSRHGRLVFGLAMSVTGDSSASEEVCQDVFLRVWEKSATYRPDKGKVVTWIARIARNRAIDSLRSRRIRETDSAPEPEEPGAVAADRRLDPAEQLWGRLRDEAVREAVATLPPEQRLALTLAFFKGLSHRQISERLGEPLGTVKTRIRDAMRKLRARLGPEEEQ